VTADGLLSRTRWISIPRNVGMIHFFHTDRVRRDGISTFMGQGDENRERGVFVIGFIAVSSFEGTDAVLLHWRW
jgi:hypothetical protein